MHNFETPSTTDSTATDSTVSTETGRTMPPLSKQRMHLIQASKHQLYKRLSDLNDHNERIALVWKNMYAKTNALLQSTSFVTAQRLQQAATVSVLSSALLVSGCSSMIAANSGTQPVGVESSDRSFGQIITDNSIARTASINLYKLDPRFMQARVNIASFHSVVLLTGQVPSESLKQLAEDNLKAMSDVRAVQNYLTVGEEIGYAQIVQDGITTANVRKNFLLLKGFKDSRVKVVTENNVVYLLGKLPDSDVQWLISTLQRTPNIAKIVSLIDILPEEAPTILPNTPVERQPLTTPTPNTASDSGNSNSAAIATPVAVDPMVESQPLTTTSSN
jgi:osmotically-inducible protein OsmY